MPREQRAGAKIDMLRPYTEREERLAGLDLYTPADVAQYFRVNPSTVYLWVKDGILPAERLTQNGQLIRPRIFIQAKAIQELEREMMLRLVQLEKYLVRKTVYLLREEKRQRGG